MSQPLPEAMRTTLASSQAPEEKLTKAIRLTGEYLHADRCFLYMRDPAAGRGRIALCWRKDDSVPNPIHNWQDDTGELPKEDPLFRAALAARPSVFVDDVETAGPEVLNLDFEHKTFGHRALIHAHITDERQQLWGILQPCLFGQPRHWTDAEKEAVEAMLPQLLPVVQAYMAGVEVKYER